MKRGGRQQRQHHADWWSEDAVRLGVTEGRVVHGVLRISKKNRNEAFVRGAELACDIFIEGELGRNRSLPGDFVAVELLPLNDWRDKALTNGALATALGELALGGSTAVEDPLWRPLAVTSSTGRAVPAAAPPEVPPRHQRSLPPPGSLAAALETPGRQPVGRVVAILASSDASAMCQERLRMRDHVGVLVPRGGVSGLRPGEPVPARDSVVQFQPLDNRIPWMMVPRHEAPHAFLADPLRYTQPRQKLWVCAMGDWPPQHRFPAGRLVRQVGEAGEIGPETEALLVEHDCDHGTFPPEALECIRKFGADANEGGIWRIPHEEIARRKDLRATRCIFTIDPPTAKDLDDALHCEEVSAGTVRGTNGELLPAHYEIGVHIADVAYFVREGSALDAEARRRATTVYLVPRCIPMLPPLLSEQLCSLNPAVDRLAYSCVWRMTREGELLPNSLPWYGRTVIRSCAKIDYGLAQRLVDGEVTAADAGAEGQSWPVERRPEKGHPAGVKVTPSRVIEDLRNMHAIAMARRRRRFARVGGGALALSRVKMAFVLDGDGNPSSVKAYPLRDSNRLVEEFMLLANYLVAQQMILGVTNSAFLRCHPIPDSRGMQQVAAKLSDAGMVLSPSALTSAGALHEEIEAMRSGRTPLPPEMIEAFKGSHADCRLMLVDILSSMLKLPMKPAQYFLVREQPERSSWRHWALNIPYYTHFTSPIRRYADICVHRILTATLDHVSEPPPATTIVTPVAQDEDERLDVLAQAAAQCNAKKEASKNAQEACDLIYLCVYVRLQQSAGSPLTLQGIVMGIGEVSFTLLFPSLGVERLVHARHDWKASSVTCVGGEHETSTRKSTSSGSSIPPPLPADGPRRLLLPVFSVWTPE